MPAKKKTALGRGFESILPTELFDDSFDPTKDQDEKISQLKKLSLDLITPDPDQPRKHFDAEALSVLANSIKKHGVLQPIVVIKKGAKYQIVAGERRWRAAKQAGLKKMPALIRTLTAQAKLELSLIENIQRQDLNIIEVATGYLKLRDQFNMSLSEISKQIGGRSISSISNTLRLLRLPPKVIELLSQNKLTEGQARPLVGLDNKLIAKLVPKIIAEKLSARQVERLASVYRKGGSKPKIKQQPLIKPAMATKLSANFSKKFKTKFQIKNLSNGQAKIEIRLADVDSFNKIKQILEDF